MRKINEKNVIKLNKKIGLVLPNTGQEVDTLGLSQG